MIFLIYLLLKIEEKKNLLEEKEYKLSLINFYRQKKFFFS